MEKSEDSEMQHVLNLSCLLPLVQPISRKRTKPLPLSTQRRARCLQPAGCFLHVQLTARWRCKSIRPLRQQLQQLIPDQLVWPRPCASNFLSFLGVPPGASLSFPVRLPVGAAVLPAGQSDGTVSPRRLHLRPQPEPESKHLTPHSLSQQSHDWLDPRC